jgi:hypothetical protein
MDIDAALTRFIAYRLILASVYEFDSTWRLPCFIFYSRVFQLLFSVWIDCYNVAAEVGLIKKECEFLFRWFLFGGVLDDEEVRELLNLALKFCERTEVPEAGWAALAELFRFASQQGRLEQPWRVSCVKSITKYRLQPH